MQRATRHFPSPRLRTGLVCAIAIAAAILSAPLQAETAAAAYQKALAREQAARAEAGSTPAVFRSIAAAYQQLVRQHPTSGYADNALWQAAGLFELAHDRWGEARDEADDLRVLKWLHTEYPTSALAKQAAARLASMNPGESTSAAAPAPPAPAPPAVTRSEVAAAPGLALSPATVREPPVSVRTVTRSALPKGERLTIELSRETVYFASRTGNPDRILFDVPNLTPQAGAIDGPALDGPLVKSFAITKGTNGAPRVALELAGHPRFSCFSLYNPFRLVVDVETDGPMPPSRPAAEAGRAGGPVADAPASATSRAAGAGAPAVVTPAVAPPPAAPSVTQKGDYSLARQLGLSVSRIVIDPGHGGRDPGARANGTTEAQIVLDVALRLEALLRAQPGTEVVLTRRKDEFVPLEQRTAIANRENADLFLSIHANASPQAGARGIETFVLNFATSPQAEALAARENATSAKSMRALPDLVKAITMNNKLAESRELASAVQTSLVRRLTPQSKAAKDLGVKQAPFAVLIGAQMPSVLAEISFLTNRTDASLLKQAAYRQRIAQALSDAIVRYRAALKKTATVAAANAR